MITNTPGSDNHNPAIYGTRIVWEDPADPLGHIFLYDITTGNITRIVNNPAVQERPSISADLIVWQDARDSLTFDIYAYSFSDGAEHAITTGHNAQYPAVSGNRIVWQDNRNGDGDIYLYDVSEDREYLLTPDTAGIDQMLPVISGNRVAWEDYRYGPAPAVFMNDTGTWTESRISSDTTGSFYQGVPSISGDTIVWEDAAANNFFSTIVMNKAGSGDQQVSDGTSVLLSDGQMAPSIDGNWVVWMDYGTDPNGQVYLNKTDTPPYSQIAITSSAEAKTSPKISGSRIVWEEENTLGTSEIHLFTLGAPGTCPAVTFSEDTASGGAPLTVSFTDTTDSVYTPVHWAWDFGDGSRSFEQNPVHTYSANGQYLVNLTVSDACCRNLSESHTIAVGTPVVQFSGTPLSGIVPLEVQFADSSTGSSLISWNWSFGDGTWYNTTVPADKNPVHPYSQSGTYTVRLFVTNAFGTGSTTRVGYISVLKGAHALATTPVNGIGTDTRFGGLYLTYDSTLAGIPVLGATQSVLVSPRLPAYGWQNITFVTEENARFTDTGGGVYEGNITRVFLQTTDTAATGFSPALNDTVFVNYRMDLPAYPDPASLKTEVWESALAADNTSISRLALHSGYTNVDTVAYTVSCTRTNTGTSGNATINMSVKSTWAAGAGTTSIIALGTDPATGNRVGMVLVARYAGTDGTLDYYTADITSPYAYLSRFVLVKLSGAGNPFQLITLTVASYMSESNTGSSGSGDAGGIVSGPAPGVQSGALEEQNPVYIDPGKTAHLYLNDNAVITQATTLASTDGKAALYIGPGIVAKDSSGNPLPEVTIHAIPASSLPTLPQGTAAMFSGMAYELGPDGATFSPDITLTFQYPGAQWSQVYSIKTYDASSGTWIDLPTEYSPGKGTVTASLSNFCTFALFYTTPPVTAAMKAETEGATAAVPLPETTPAPTTAVSIFIDMILWVFGIAAKNLLIVGIAAVIILIFFVIRRKKRRDRIRYML